MTTTMFLKDFDYGPYAWPGGYPRFAVCDDGDALCFTCCEKEKEQILDAIRDEENNGWRVVGFDINWEDPLLICCHCAVQIESAYGDDPTDGCVEIPESNS